MQAAEKKMKNRPRHYTRKTRWKTNAQSRQQQHYAYDCIAISAVESMQKNKGRSPQANAISRKYQGTAGHRGTLVA
jgi:hypothetical protein